MEMESTWYLKPGQTIENTKIEDRGHALLITKNSWGKITRHLDRKRQLQEELNKEKAQKLALKKGSEEMTKNWDNSMENIRIRKEEARAARLQKVTDDRMQNFFKLREEQQAIKEKFIEDARKTMYISRGHPKVLTSSLILSEVLYEREKQLDLQKKIEGHEKEDNAKYAQKIKEAAEQEKRENLEKQQKSFKKSIEMRDLYLKEIYDKQKTIKMLKEERIQQERHDIDKMEKEFATIKEIEKEEETKRIANVKKEFNDFFIKQQQNKEQLDLEDKEQNIVIDIYSKAKHRIDCLRKKREEDIQKSLQARREAASKQATADAKTKMENEERVLKKAQEDREQEEIEKLKAKAAHKEQLIKDRNENRQAFLKREEIRKAEENEVKKWDMLNRFKTNELTVKYEEDKKKRLWQETLQYRKALFDQMAENDAERNKKKEEAHKIYQEALAKIDEENRKFFGYATEVYEYAKGRGRRTSPVRRVIDEYKKEYNLPRNIKPVCENYELDNSKSKKILSATTRKCPEQNP